MDSKFIVIEGLDGSGKTTQTKITAERLEKRLIKTHVTAEPTKNTYGKLCREYLSGRPASKTLCAAVFEFFDTVFDLCDLFGQKTFLPLLGNRDFLKLRVTNDNCVIRSGGNSRTELLTVLRLEVFLGCHKNIC